MRRFCHLNPECRGRVGRAESDPGTLETKKSGDKQRRKIGYSVQEGLPMLNATFTALMLFAYQ